MNDGTLDRLLTEAARRGRPAAVIDGERRVSLSRFNTEVTALAVLLSGHGVRTGDRVAISMTASLDALAAMFAVMRAGGTVVPVNPQAAVPTLRRCLTEAGVRAVICAAGDAGCPAVRAMDGPVQIAELHTGMVTGSLTMAGPVRAARATATGREPEPADLAGIFLTTGTTGDGALVRHTHASLTASVRALEAMRRAYFRPNSRSEIARLLRMAWIYRRQIPSAAGRQTWLTPMPLHSIAGMRFMTQAILTGQRLVVMPSFHPRTFADLIARHRVSIVALTPTMLEAVLAVRSRGGPDLRSLLAIGLGGAPASAELISRAAQTLGCPVLNGYGSTETGGGILAARIGDTADGSVGYPFPGVDVRVVDEAGRQVADGTVGELICRTSSLRTADGAGTGTDPGWYRTGDLARVGQRGEIHIVGRSRDLIIRGGLKIVPAAVERVLSAHPAVAECSVVGMADTLAGERIVAFVVPTAGRAPTVADFATQCGDRLAPHEIPDHVVTVSELPRAESGEIRKAELRAMAVRVLRSGPGQRATIQGGSVR